MSTPDPGTLPLLHTKLYSTLITPDLVKRTRLLERLNRNRQRPLTLICAPAGFGKSVLASLWLQASNYPGAWVSLDKNDNDLRTFLSYLLSAVRSAFPSIELKTQTLIEAPNLPPVPTIARYLLNDLDQIEMGLILVLDDIHLIHEQEIFELLDEILQHPPRSLQLVLVGRRDPPLPISTLRAKQQVTEIRLHDLRFSAAETSLLLGEMLNREIQESTALEWTEKTEGWVTALRLAALSLRYRDWEDDLTIGIEGDSKYLQEYLLADVLAHLSYDKQDWLLKISTQDRFCASLCGAVVQVDSDSVSDNSSGKEFIQWLQSTNLFLIPLDEHGQWFRFHHLFQQILHNMLKNQMGQVQINALHARASAWFAENNLIEEAIQHALAADDAQYAAQLVVKHRYDLMNKEKWNRLKRWLTMLPADVIDENPELLITKAWIVEYSGDYLEAFSINVRVESLLPEIPRHSPEWNRVQGEFNCFLAEQYYLSSQPELALNKAEEALRLLPAEAQYPRTFTLYWYAFASQMLVESDKGVKLVQEEIDNSPSSSHSRLLLALCSVYSMDGDLYNLKYSAQKCLQLAGQHHLLESVGLAHWHLGNLHYLRNEFPEAISSLQHVIENRYTIRPLYYPFCAFTQALIQTSQGQDQEAWRLVEEATDFAEENNNSFVLGVCREFKVELALRQGETDKIKDLMAGVDFNLYPPFWFYFFPQLTLVKALIALGTPDSIEDANSQLDALAELAQATHNINFQINVLAVQALLHYIKGDETTALKILSESLALAEPSGFIRNYVDLGPKMADLLTQLSSQGVSGQSQLSRYITRILAAFPAEAEPASIVPGTLPLQNSLVEPLTKRELQTLKYLATQLSTDEIAAEMFVSADTVRSHTKNIYSKLNVHSRFEAVHQAEELGLI